MSFDHRSVSKNAKHEWGHGRGVLRIAMESSVVVREPLYVDCVVITLSLHDWARRVTPGRPPTPEQQQQQQYYCEEMSPPLRQRWIDHLQDFAAPERTFSWPELVARLRSFPRIPPPALGFFLQTLSREAGDAARKAVFLEHRTMAVAVEISVVTDVPSERPAIPRFPAAPVKEVVCDHKCGDAKCWGCSTGFSPRPYVMSKEEEAANMCRLSL